VRARRDLRVRVRVVGDLRARVRVRAGRKLQAWEREA
jgi:hypothetical protein